MHIKKLRKYFTKRICGGCGCGGGGSRDETDDKRRAYEESTNTHNRARFHTNLMNKWKEFLIKNYGREHTEHGGAQTHTHAHIQPNDRPSEDAAKRQKTDDKRKERSLCFCWRELLSFSIQLIEFSSTLIINDFIKISILFILYIAGFLFLSFFHVYLLFAFVLLHWRRRESQTSKQYFFFLPAQIQTFFIFGIFKMYFSHIDFCFFSDQHIISISFLPAVSQTLTHTYTHSFHHHNICPSAASESSRSLMTEMTHETRKLKNSPAAAPSIPIEHTHKKSSPTSETFFQSDFLNLPSFSLVMPDRTFTSLGIVPINN